MRINTHLLKKSFSIIELLTVILVILLLISLLIPLFSDLKMNARNALCKSQMRQISILNTSYITDFDGFLPNNNMLDLNSDGKRTIHNWKTGGVEALVNAPSNSLMYEGWNGHLLPYIQSVDKNYDKRAKIGTEINKGKVEAIVKSYIFKTGWSNTASAKLDPSWNIINDTIEKGGYNELKVFVCPEIHSNTYDIGFSNAYNGIQIPRISQIGNGGFLWTRYVSPGVPTTYLANQLFFGWDYLGGSRDSPIGINYNSLRLDQISNLSQKALIIEGGSFVSPPSTWAYYTGDPYYEIGDITNQGFKNHRLSFVHDSISEFWIITVSKWHDGSGNFEMESAFNKRFLGKAEMIIDWGAASKCYKIISYIDPKDKPFHAFLLPFGIIASQITQDVVVDFPEYHYRTGKMNVLFGDSSVQSKDLGWLASNKVLISTLTSE